MWHDEAEVSTFVDDPLILAAGSSKRERTRTFMKYCVLWLALGLEMSWPKANRGFGLDWIGFHVSVDNLKGQQKIVVKLMENKHQKLMEVAKELLACKGVLPLTKLQLAVGIWGGLHLQCRWQDRLLPCSYHTAADAQERYYADQKGAYLCEAS